MSAGDDFLSGGRGADVYVREAGTSGADQINDLGGSAGDLLKIEDATLDNVTFERVGNDVELDFADGSSISLIGQMATAGTSTIEAIEFADGQTITAAEIAALANTESGTDASVVGTSASETLIGGFADDTIDGLTGDDRMEGGAGSDLYIRRIGDGDDTIFDIGGGAHAQTDRVTFEDLTVADVVFRRMQSGDLEVETISTGEILRVEGQFLGSTAVGIEEFGFSDGTVLSASDIVAIAPISGTSGNDHLTRI